MSIAYNQMQPWLPQSPPWYFWVNSPKGEPQHSHGWTVVDVGDITRARAAWDELNIDNEDMKRIRLSARP